ncbi:MAG: hypothetical protein JNL74_13580, partial [Fibrobacteres bacterium]|nr:hypothetical protein [Fibrobacterota bacterium]
NASGVSNCAFASESVVSSQFIFPDTLESELTIKIRSLISYSNGKIDSSGNAMFYRLIQGDAAECDFEGIVKGKSGRQGLVKIEAARGLAIVDTLTMAIVPSTAKCDSIQLNAKSLKLCVRDTFRLYAVKTFFSKGDQHFIKTSLPGDTFQWTVSDTSVLSAKSGSLIGKKAGSVVVTAQFMGSVARCSVVVRPRPSVLMRLDFRCDTLSPSFGWLPVGGARVTYSSVWGYGWIAGSIDCRSNRSSHFLITSTNSTPSGRFKVNVPAGSYIVRSALGDWAYPPAALSEVVIYQGDTLCGHLTVPGSRQAIKDDTITVVGDTGAVFDIKGTITYMVIISNEGIPMSLVADDSVETVVPPIGVENGIASSVIVTASLHSAPNPFNPSVNITIDLPQNVYAVYRIVDINGRLMYHTSLRAGVHGTRSRILWNGCDKNGKAVSAGCYFGLLKMSNNKTLTNKLMFLK